MQTVAELPFPRQRRAHAVPPLENGDHLSATEFLRRYSAMPEVKKAELIQGQVYLMASPVRADQHGDPDSFIQGCLFNYAAATPGVKASVNATVRLGPDDTPQPDASLRILPEHGGRSSLDDKGLISGPPELVVEIAASSVSVDTRAKRDSYRRGGVLEYIVWRTWDGEVDGWRMQEDEYVPWTPDENGILHSMVFPGLWLNLRALVLEDAASVLGSLREGLATAEHAQFCERLRAALTPTPNQ
jgi:Uma2 family endonuclease